MDSIDFGVELEVAAGGGDALAHLVASGYADDDYLHEYHCGRGYGDCPQCNPRRSSPDWTAQEDCTADAEFISRILTSHTASADDAIAGLADALVSGRVEFDSDVGMHVHVNGEPFRNDAAAIVRLWRLWLNYQTDVSHLARATQRGVRGYAAGAAVSDAAILGYRPDVDGFFSADHDEAFEMLTGDGRSGCRTGRWLSGGTGSGTGTFEFRIWNATRSHWRIRLAVYVSAAIALAALNGYDASPDSGDTLLDAIGEHLPDDVWMGVYKQLLAHDDTAAA